MTVTQKLALATLVVVLLSPAVVLLVGDRWSQGAGVVLVDEGSDRVWVSSGPVPAGTRATVVQDAEELAPDRKIKVVLRDPPYAGRTGTVSRRNLRGE